MAPNQGMEPLIDLKVFNLEMFLSQGMTGTKNEAKTEGRAIWDSFAWRSVLSADTKL